MPKPRKVNAEMVVEIRKLARQGYKHYQIAERVGVRASSVSNIVRYKTWKTLL